MKRYEDDYAGRNAYDITDKDLSEVLGFMHRHGLDPYDFSIEYANCGSHTVILVDTSGKA